MNLGEFEILATIGTGGAGIVYKARHLRLNRIVALKQVHCPPGEDGRRMAERVLEEARLMAGVRSDHVVTLYADHLIDGKPALEFEFMEGGSLQAILAERDLMPVEGAEILVQVLRGLVAIHAAGLIHRDVKPGNILSDGKGRYKIADFGIAVARGASHTLAATGTAQYVAPEVVMPPHAFDQRGDLYSAGMTAYETLLGDRRFQEIFRDLFEGGAVAADHKWVNWACDAGASPRALAEIRPDVPARVSEVVSRLMCKDPTGRFASAQEALEALAPHAATPAGAAALASPASRPTRLLPRPATAPEYPPRSDSQRRPRRAWPYVALSLGMTALIVVAGLLQRRRPVDVEVQTDPPAAFVEWAQGRLRTPAKLQGLRPGESYALTFSKPGYEVHRATLEPTAGVVKKVFSLTPSCAAADEPLLRVRFDDVDLQQATDFQKEFVFARVVGPGCDVDALVIGGEAFSVTNGAGESLAEFIPASDASLVSAVGKRLEALYLHRVLAGGGGADSGLALRITRRGEPSPADAVGSGSPPAVRACVGAGQPCDSIVYWVRSSERGKLLLLEINPLGGLFVLFPNDRSETDEIRAGEWLRVPARGDVQVEPPLGRDTVLAALGSDFPALKQAFPSLTASARPLALASSGRAEPSAARKFAQALAKDLAAERRGAAALSLTIQK